MRHEEKGSEADRPDETDEEFDVYNGIEFGDYLSGGIREGYPLWRGAVETKTTVPAAQS